jgi:hypothetical protein
MRALQAFELGRDLLKRPFEPMHVHTEGRRGFSGGRCRLGTYR